MPDLGKLQNWGEESAAALTEVLSSLIGREVSVSLSQVFESDSGTLVSSLEAPCFFTTLKGSGGVDGQALILFKEKDTSVFADLLIGQDGTAAPDKMTELHLSAFGEVVIQLADVLTQTVKKTVGTKALWEVKEKATMPASAVSQLLSGFGPSFVVFSFGLFVQDLVSSDLFFCIPGPVAERISSGAGKTAAAEPAVMDQTGVSVGNTQSRAGGVAVQQLENEFSGETKPTGGNIGLLMDVPLRLTVELGRTNKLVKEILALAPGSVVELDKLAGEPVDILINEKLIAKGEVVVIDENFGVRITEIINPEERLTAVQG
jgi:flagellar motor switch protein FliN/FliY